MNYKTIINKYIADATAGRLVIGELARLRVQRHLNDLKNEHHNGLYFDEKAAMKALTFFNFLKHPKGSDFAGREFVLSPWQAFDVYNIFGWKTAGGKRRFRYAYTDIARKNGKTTYAAAIALFTLIMDNEQGAEVYTVATKKDQAKICLEDARNIVKQSKDLSVYTEVWQHSVTCEMIGSSMKALSSDSNTLDGLNPHCVILDEFHAHKDDLVFNVMKSAMGARVQPLMMILTTAGFNRNVPCYSYRDVAIKVLKGILKQDDLYISIHTLDPDDDYHDPANWQKSNPNLNISVKENFLIGEYNDAKNNPDRMYNFLTKNLNIWTDSAKQWLPSAEWEACNKGEEDLTGEVCYAGLDLASVRDTNALALCFPRPEGNFSFKVFFWMPEMNVLERVKNKGINYDRWIREGYMRTTDGNITDYNYIKEDIKAICKEYKVQNIQFDRWNSSQLVIDLMYEGLNMVPFGQGFASMSAPTKELERLVMSNKMNHMGNPVLTWHVSNVFLQRDASGNLKIDKDKSSEKVDGAVACVMALAGYMIAHGADSKNNVNVIYGSKGIRTI